MRLERKNKEEIKKLLQDLDPKGSPHLEEKRIGGDCRSRSPLLDPSRMSKNHGDNQEIGQVLQSQQWRRESARTYPTQGGRRPIYSPSRNLTVWEVTSSPSVNEAVQPGLGPGHPVQGPVRPGHRPDQPDGTRSCAGPRPGRVQG
jgi:hypothetical protein